MTAEVALAWLCADAVRRAADLPCLTRLSKTPDDSGSPRITCTVRCLPA